MVSILLDIIKFLLIYRYLQNAYWFKSGTGTYRDGKNLTCPPTSPHKLHAYSFINRNILMCIFEQTGFLVNFKDLYDVAVTTST